MKLRWIREVTLPRRSWSVRDAELEQPAYVLGKPSARSPRRDGPVEFDGREPATRLKPLSHCTAKLLSDLGSGLGRKQGRQINECQSVSRIGWHGGWAAGGMCSVRYGRVPAAYREARERERARLTRGTRPRTGGASHLSWHTLRSSDQMMSEFGRFDLRRQRRARLALI
jgi:hypothetical protein